MRLLLATAVGFLAARLLWLLLRSSLRQPLFLRPNWRGRAVPTGAGIVLALAVLVVEGVRAVAAAAEPGGGAFAGPARTSTLLLALGLGLLGLFDDLAGAGGPESGRPEARGFRGHLGALAAGRLTSGGLKLLGGAAVALVAASPFALSAARLLVDAALVALAANLGNLLDRAPGRTVKVGGLAFVALAVGGAASPRLVNVAIVAGAALGLLADDLAERLMLGDAGANVLGGVLGLGVVIVAQPSVRLVVLVVLAALNLVSEWVSFSRVIDAVPPLRALDRAGRRQD